MQSNILTGAGLSNLAAGLIWLAGLTWLRAGLICLRSRPPQQPAAATAARYGVPTQRPPPAPAIPALSPIRLTPAASAACCVFAFPSTQHHRAGISPPPPPCGFVPWSRGPSTTEEVRVAAILASAYHYLHVGPPSSFHAGQHERVLGAGGGIKPA
jgi:hypothetical protein